MPLLTSLAATPTRPANGMARQAMSTPMTTATAPMTARCEALRPAFGRPWGRLAGDGVREDMGTRVRGEGLAPSIPLAQPNSHIGLCELSHSAPVWTGVESFTFLIEIGMAAMGAADRAPLIVGIRAMWVEDWASRAACKADT